MADIHSGQRIAHVAAAMGGRAGPGFRPAALLINCASDSMYEITHTHNAGSSIRITTGHLADHDQRGERRFGGRGEKASHAHHTKAEGLGTGPAAAILLQQHTKHCARRNLQWPTMDRTPPPIRRCRSSSHLINLCPGRWPTTARRSSWRRGAGPIAASCNRRTGRLARSSFGRNQSTGPDRRRRSRIAPIAGLKCGKIGSRWNQCVRP